MYRFDGLTGRLDESWFPDGSFSFASDYRVGPDGHLYVRTGSPGHGRWIYRVDREGKEAPFTRGVLAEAQPGALAAGGVRPAPKMLVTGSLGQAGTWQCGFDVAEDGRIVAVLSRHLVDLREPGAIGAAMAPSDRSLQVARDLGLRVREGVFVAIWENDGLLVTVDALEGATYGGSMRMDRDGSLYIAQTRVLPAGHSTLDGLAGAEEAPRASWGNHGTLIKFRGLGNAFPLGRLFGAGTVPGVPGEPPPGALALAGDRNAAEEALWAYGGLTFQTGEESHGDGGRFEMDGWARLWIPANQLYSVMVLDANGNRIARLGRYGNVDDPGLRFAWHLAAAVSDRALYVLDCGNRRILKAALQYSAEEEVPLP